MASGSGSFVIKAICCKKWLIYLDSSEVYCHISCPSLYDLIVLFFLASSFLVTFGIPMHRKSHLHSVPWKWSYFYHVFHIFFNPRIHDFSPIFVLADSNPCISTHSSCHYLWDTFMPPKYISCSSLGVFGNFYVLYPYSIVVQSVLFPV